MPTYIVTFMDLYVGRERQKETEALSPAEAIKNVRARIALDEREIPVRKLEPELYYRFRAELAPPPPPPAPMDPPPGPRRRPPEEPMLFNPPHRGPKTTKVGKMTVETWYDKQSKNWITQLKNETGSQVGDARFDGSRFAAIERSHQWFIEEAMELQNLGDCYHWASTNALKYENRGFKSVKVIHANVQDTNGKRFGHAWIEADGRVYDWQTVVKMGEADGWDKKTYYQIAKPKGIHEYTATEAAVRPLREGYRAWHLDEERGSNPEDGESSAFTLPAGTILYHGSPEPYASQIRETGVLITGLPHKLGVGSLSEGGLVWFATERRIAEQYARGSESGRHSAAKGSIFAYELSEPLRVAGYYMKLSQEQADILNAVIPLPDYKALGAGTSLFSAAYRAYELSRLREKYPHYRTSGGEMMVIWPTILRAIGFDAYAYGDGGQQIAMPAESLPVRAGNNPLRG